MSDLDTRLAATIRKPDEPPKPLPDVAAIRQGVTVQWLAQVFDMNHQTVRDRLSNCPAIATRIRGTKQTINLYDLKTAAAYLVTPKLASSTYLKALKRGDLPTALSQQAWDALLKRQKWEENAGDLWRTDKIREVLRDTFQGIKFATQLWGDTLDRQVGLTADQRKLVDTLSDKLLESIQETLVDRVARNKTGAQIDELPGLIGESMEEGELDAEDDAEIEELI